MFLIIFSLLLFLIFRIGFISCKDSYHLSSTINCNNTWREFLIKFMALKTCSLIFVSRLTLKKLLCYMGGILQISVTQSKLLFKFVIWSFLHIRKWMTYELYRADHLDKLIITQRKLAIWLLSLSVTRERVFF